MSTIAIVLVAWVIISIATGLLLGAMIRLGGG
jgi:hypothetical protein